MKKLADIQMKYIIFIIMTICWIVGFMGLTFNIDIPQGSSKNLELTKLVFLFIGAYGVITATYFTVENSLESTRNVKAKIDFDKTDNSMKFIERWDGPSLKEARDFTRIILEKRQNITGNELLKEINSDEKLQRSVITTFNFWEGMHFAIQHKNVNEDMLEEAFWEPYCNMYKTFEIWINSMKNEYPDLTKNLQILYNKWLK